MIFCPNRGPVNISVSSQALKHSKLLEQKWYFHHCFSQREKWPWLPCVVINCFIAEKAYLLLTSGCLKKRILQKRDVQKQELNFLESHSQFQSQAQDVNSQTQILTIESKGRILQSLKTKRVRPRWPQFCSHCFILYDFVPVTSLVVLRLRHS